MLHGENSIESVAILSLLVKCNLKISGNVMKKCKSNKTTIKIKFLKRYYKIILDIEIYIITNYYFICNVQ